MNNEEIKREILAYFADKREGVAPSLETNYLEQQIVDSLGIVELIAEFEEKFGIQFTADDLQDEDFQTVAGLISIVQRRVG